MAPARGVLEACRALARCRHTTTADAVAGIVLQLQHLRPWFAAGSPHLRSGSGCPSVLPLIQHTWLVQGYASMAAYSRERWQSPLWQQATPLSHARFATKTRKSSPLSDRYKTRPTNYVQLLQHIHRARKLSQLEELLASFGDKFDAVHVAAAITVLPKCLRHKLGSGEVLPAEQGMQAAVLLAKLQSMASEHKGRLYVRQIANMVWALGQCRKLPVVDVPLASSSAPTSRGAPRKQAPTPVGVTRAAAGLLEDLLDEVSAKGYRGCGGRDVAQLLHGMARLRLKHRMALNRLARFTICHADKFEVKHLALAAWGFARLRYDSQALYRTLADAAAAQHVYLRPWSGAALLGAFARRGMRHPGVCAAACEALSVQVRSFGAREMGVVAWALGRLRHRDAPLMEALAAHAADVLDTFRPLELGLLLKGLTDARVVSKVLMDRVAAGIAAEPAVVIAPADGVRILAAFAMLDPHNASAPAMGERVAAACARRVSELSGRQAADAVLALARLGVRHDGLLLALGEHVAAMLDAAAPLDAAPPPTGSRTASSGACGDADLVNVLVGFNRVHYVHRALCKAACKRLEQLTKEQAAEDGTQLPGHVAAAALQHAIDIASELATAGELPTNVGSGLASVLSAHLQAVRPRKLAMALRALSWREGLLQTEPVKQLFADCMAPLAQLFEVQHTDLEQQQQQASPLVLSACTLAFARAGHRGQLDSSDALLGRLFGRAAEQLQEFSEPQAQELFAALQLSGDVEHAQSLGHALQLLGQQRGWQGLERATASL